MMVSRFKRFDWLLFGVIVFFGIVSSVTLLSFNPNYFYRNIVFYIFALLVILLGSQIDWQWFLRQSWFRHGIYWFSIALLAFATFGFTEIRGAKSWIVIGNFQFEPAELVKFALIIFLAGFFVRRHIETWYFRNILTSFLITALPAALAMLQPDFGSVIIFFGIWFSFLLIGGLNIKRLAIIIFLGILTFLILWFTVLHPYQKNRIIAFLFPSHDPLGVNYNVTQSKISIGSGGFWGKGFGGSSQAKLNFLPAATTDFLFAVFIEEWGFVGGVILIAVFIFFIYRLINIGQLARDNYARFVVLGTVSFIFIHFFVNIGANLGFLPVTGLTLSFISYGGSHLLTVAFLISIIEHIKLEAG